MPGAVGEDAGAKKPRLGNHQDGGNVQDLMKLYYGRLYPHQTMYKWLAYGNDKAKAKHPRADKSFFSRREFCFTLDGDIFVRYQSFKDGAELESAIKKRCPSKIDIGPVYNVDPRKRAAYSGGSGDGSGATRTFQPVERELVFDIDMDDYNDVLNYNLGDHGWDKCWSLMAVAIQILDRGLREDFGFEHVFFVFSGRRGIHCWVCDKRARELTDEQRSAVANYFSIYKGIEAGRAKLMLSVPRHPSVQRALDILEPCFVDQILPSQELLEPSESWERILQYVPDQDVCDKLRDRWQSGRRSSMLADEEINRSRWLELCKEVDKCLGRTKDPMKRRQLVKCKDEIIFAHAYPKLDVEVSKKRNHLLKAPFCVHPKTGKVCVPIDPAAAETFDPERDAPTVASLLNELDSGAEATAMTKNVELFEDLFLKSLGRANQEELTQKTRETIGNDFDF